MRPFQYERARTLGDAARLVAGADAMAIAGGTNLLDLMKLQVETPGELVDINREKNVLHQCPDLLVTTIGPVPLPSLLSQENNCRVSDVVCKCVNDEHCVKQGA